jgi:hypothetical protein
MLPLPPIAMFGQAGVNRRTARFLSEVGADGAFCVPSEIVADVDPEQRGAFFAVAEKVAPFNIATSP